MTNEERDLPDVRPSLGYIETRHDPARRVYVSRVPEPPKKIGVEEIAGIAAGIIESGCCLAMVYLVSQLI